MKRKASQAHMKIALSFVLAMTAMTAAAADPCDPFEAQNNQAQQARISGKLDGAQRLAGVVIAQAPTDFRANYTKGLILIDRSGLDKPGPLSKTLNRPLFDLGMTELQEAAKLLDGAQASCAASHGWYGIYNTIGADYLNAEKLDSGAHYLEIATSHWDALNSRTKQHLLRNLEAAATAYYNIHKFDEAIRIYSVIAKIGDSKAAAVAIATVKNAEKLSR